MKSINFTWKCSWSLGRPDAEEKSRLHWLDLSWGKKNNFFSGFVLSPCTKSYRVMAADPSRRQKRRENFPKLKSTHTMDILYIIVLVKIPYYE